MMSKYTNSSGITSCKLDVSMLIFLNIICCLGYFYIDIVQPISGKVPQNFYAMRKAKCAIITSFPWFTISKTIAHQPISEQEIAQLL